MAKDRKENSSRSSAQSKISEFEAELGPFVVAVETTRMPMLFTDAQSPQNEILYVNESFLRLSKYERSDIVGRPFSATLAPGVGAKLITLEAIEKAGSQSPVHIRCARNGGEQFDAAVFASQFINKQGTLQQYFVSFVDLNENLETRRRDQVRTNELYRHAPGFIAITQGKEHRFVFANPAYELLIGRRARVGERAADVLPEAIEQGLIKLLDQVFETGCHFSSGRMSIQLKRDPSGPAETRYVEFVYQPITDDEGIVTGLFCEGSDVTDVETTATELKQAQVQLMHLSRISAMGTMAATVAHELNQPLASISNYAAGCANLLASNEIETGALHNGLDAIEAAANRAGNIIRGLRDMTRKTAVHREQFPLAAAVEAAAALVKAQGCDTVPINITIRSQACVLGDRVQIEQVVVNLLKNACEALTGSDSTGCITVTVSKREGEIGVTIKDEGPGISAEDREALFEWTGSSKPDGMGLGLSISRTIIESHGGRIGLDHTGSTGSCFSFWLSVSDR